MSELKINNVSVLTESGGEVTGTLKTLKMGATTVFTESGGTVTAQNMGFSANDAGVKTALNASGNAPIYACRAWVNFRGTSQSGTATASGLVTGLYTATVVTATQFTVEYSGTTYTINTSGNHNIGDGEGVELTVSNTTVTIDTQIRKSGNVSSCQFNGTGNYTINFATAMPDTDYIVCGIGVAGSTQSVRIPTIETGNTYSTSQFQIKYQRYDGLLSSQENCFLAIFR